MPLYKLKIKTLSPIHIGDGGIYDGMTLFPVDKKFIPLDFPLLIKVFAQHNIPFEKFKEWIVDEKNKRRNQKPSIDEFLERNYRSSYASIKNAIEKSAGLELDSLCFSRVRGDIYSCLKDMNQQPYISGSEVKGAIVTALLYSFLKDDRDFFRELQMIYDRNKAVLDSIYETMLRIKRLVAEKKDAGFKNFMDMNIPKDEWIEFRDILTMRPDKEIARIESELQASRKYTNQKIQQIIDLIEDWREGDKVNYNQLIKDEKRKYDKRKIKGIIDQISILEEKYMAKYFSTKLNSSSENDTKLMRFLQISDSKPIVASKIAACLIVHQNPKITMNLYFEIIDSQKETESICRINNDMPGCMNHLGFNERMIKSIEKEQIITAIHQFSKAILASEKSYFNAMGGGYRFQVQDVLQQLTDLENNNQPMSPLLRIGKAQGFLSLTLSLLLKEYDKRNNTQLFNRLIGVVQSEKNNPNNYPVTRRLITDNDKRLKLPGWLKLNLEEIK